MTTTLETSATTVLDAVQDLAPTIAERAAEVEAGRRLPLDLVESLTAAGCFRLLLPASHGGAERSLPEAMRVWEALARVDGSVGWTVMIGASGWCDLAGLPRPTFDALYAEGPDVIIGGVFAPSGSAVAVDGGYRVSGRWSFASGCQHSQWLYGHCMEGVGADQRMRMALLSPGDVVIEDTWHVSGLRGTGSHHFRADGVVVPAERTFLTMEDEPSIDATIVNVPPPALYALQIASVAVGIAQGALDDIVALATDKVPLLASSALAANPLFQHQLATADTQLRAARTLLYADTEEAWATASDRAPFANEQRAHIRSTVSWAVAQAVAVVETAYHAGGSNALYVTSPLQRRLRDIHALTQHFLVKPDALTTAGAVLAGLDVELGLY
ncbi:MAG TPA: acyl-CoA dehydrogenase family protein [Mycobacteriales bacterium]|nr:acyl-CoA dehydrogenase family protein [Mycobacteriales bacterium]